jgi:DNA-binding FadR family transcriptional regulator
MSEPVRPPKAAVVVAAGLRRRIVLGDLPEGAALPNESELMSQYQVSRPTLREALRILETESLISVKRGAGGGARVAHPDPSVAARHAATVLRIQGTTLADVFTARSIIEPAAVDLVVARARVDPSVLQPLRRLHEESTATRHDAQRYASVAARFHEQVIELAGNRTLTLIGLILLEIVEAHNQATFAAIDRGDEIVEHAQEDHATLIEMIEHGDEEASAYWRQHMRGATEAAFAALGADATISKLEPSL